MLAIPPHWCWLLDQTWMLATWPDNLVLSFVLTSSPIVMIILLVFIIRDLEGISRSISFFTLLIQYWTSLLLVRMFCIPFIPVINICLFSQVQNISFLKYGLQFLKKISGLHILPFLFYFLILLSSSLFPGTIT